MPCFERMKLQNRKGARQVRYLGINFFRRGSRGAVKTLIRKAEH